MSFGYGVGDIIAVGQLAWNVYKSCRDAPESFNNIMTEVLSLQAVLKEAEETLSDCPLSVSKKANLATILNGCRSVLEDLQVLVDNYESLGTQSKRTFDRMGWGTHDIAELRARLMSNVAMLNTFMSTSQVVVEKKLNKLIQEFKNGKREGSVISVVTVESLSSDEKDMWRSIRKELEDIGISVAAFDANKGFIMQWFREAITSGAFEEQTLPEPSTSKSSDYSRASRSTDTWRPFQQRPKAFPDNENADSFVETAGRILSFFRTRRARKPQISAPTQPVHVTHVTHDFKTGEIRGLPNTWRPLIEAYNDTPDEVNTEVTDLNNSHR